MQIILVCNLSSFQTIRSTVAIINFILTQKCLRLPESLLNFIKLLGLEKYSFSIVIIPSERVS